MGMAPVLRFLLDRTNTTCMKDLRIADNKKAPPGFAPGRGFGVGLTWSY